MAFSLAPVPPFRLDFTVWALRRQPANCVDEWDGQTYRRVLILKGRPVQVSVVQIAPVDSPRIRVTVEGDRLTRATKSAVAAALEWLLAIRIDLTDFYRFAPRDAKLEALVQRFRGLKPPRFQTVFETLANAVACQQVTLALGIQLLSRLAETYGPSPRQLDSPGHAFPCPEALAHRRAASLRRIGFSRQKARALIEIARAAAGQQLDAEALKLLDDTAAVQRLCALHGIGRWSAEYVLLRGLGRLHVFPGDDVGARNHLQHWLKLKKPLDYDGVSRVIREWSPYGGLVYFHLLLRRLAEKRWLSA